MAELKVTITNLEPLLWFLLFFLHFGQTKLLIIFALYDFDCQKRRSLYFSGKVMMMMIH